MKKNKILSGIAIVAISTVALFSFTNENDPPQFRKYEVLRTVDGEMTKYDTIISIDSDYSAMDYLTDLGFEDDENLSIINFSAEKMIFDREFDTYFNMNDLDSILSIEMIQLHKELEGLDEELEKMNEELENMQFENHMIILDCDSMHMSMGEHEMIWIEEGMDSLINFEFNSDSLHFVFEHMIFLDSMDFENEMHEMRIELDMDMENHFDEEHMNFEIMTMGKDDGDHTVILVSEGKSKEELNGNSFFTNESNNDLKIYPNPASDEVNIQFTYEGLEETTIIISDAGGNVVDRINLGEFEGTYSSLIDVSEWSKGVYFIQIERSGMNMIEKLIIE